MKKCPVCKKEIASDAVICPHCGHPIEVKEKDQNALLKRKRMSYSVEVSLMFLPILLVIIYLIRYFTKGDKPTWPFIVFATAWLLFSILSIISIKKKSINNKMVKDLIYYDKNNKVFIIYPLDQHEYVIDVKNIINVKKDNLLTSRTYITFKSINEDKITCSNKKYDLGYSDTKELNTFKTKLKSLVDVSSIVE